MDYVVAAVFTIGCMKIAEGLRNSLLLTGLYYLFVGIFILAFIFLLTYTFYQLGWIKEDKSTTPKVCRNPYTGKLMVMEKFDESNDDARYREFWRKLEVQKKQRARK